MRRLPVRRSTLALVTAAAVGGLLAPAAPAAALTDPAGAPLSVLTGRSVLPANTFWRGPTSGQHIGGPVNGVTPPFAGAQPVQGFSAVLPYTSPADGTYWALADNGYGALENSSDFLLRLYRIRPDLRTSTNPSGGRTTVLSALTLSDPDHKVPYTITHEYTDRKLTGADFDPESVQRDRDGSLWIGEEFGPSLLHVDAKGKLLHAPFGLPDTVNGGELRSPQNGGLEETAAIRTMNALRERAVKYRDTKPLVISPSYQLLAGIPGNPGVASRTTPPAGLAPASSALFDPAALLTDGFTTVPYTVDAVGDIDRLLQAKDARNANRPTIAGLISDYPDRLYAEVVKYRPDAIDPVTGLVDRTKFDLQAHRGGRGLRPENTLGSFEAGLDSRATTLESDDAITKDGVLVLSHDPYVNADKCRRTDGAAYGKADQVLIHDLTVAKLQSQFICDKTLAAYPQADNTLAASPLAADFAASRGLQSPFVIPTTQQLFDFVGYYADRQQAAGNTALSTNASRVHFNLETKTNPLPQYAARTASAQAFATKLGTLIVRNGLSDRADIQSFDFRELLQVQQQFPAIQTVYLFGDTPNVPGVEGADGTNLQPAVPGGNSPWLAGLSWPYRVTQQVAPARVAPSSGFEGLAISPDGTTLYPMLEKALAGAPGALIAQFDLRTQSFSTKTWTYPFSARPDADPATGIGVGFSADDFQLVASAGKNRLDGIVVERDGTIGQAAVDKGLKRVYEVAFDVRKPGTVVAKKLVLDLERVADPAGVAVGAPGDIGIGGGTFALPANTIEALLVESPTRIDVLNDNNYPFDAGRQAGRPQDDEFLQIDLSAPLGSLAPQR